MSNHKGKLMVLLLLIALGISFFMFKNKDAEKEKYESISQVIKTEELPRRYNEPYFFKELFSDKKYSDLLAYEVALKIGESNPSKAYRNLEYINNSLDVTLDDYLNLNNDAGVEESVVKELEFKYAHGMELIEKGRTYEAYNLLKSEIMTNHEDSKTVAEDLKVKHGY